LRRNTTMADLLPEPYGTKPLTTTPVVVKDESATLKEYPELYVAGSEPLAADEMRITALGTGYPSRRGQGCAGFMVELGNDEVFIFDAGAGTNAAFNHMRIPYHKANKFFLTHYHIDHIGDLIVYYDFGQSNGRLEPMNVYGPTGEFRELGIKALVENMLRMATWHDHSKFGNLDPRGFEVVPHEFAFEQKQVVYDENGATVTAFPVPHGLDGAVGYRLDWNGLSMVFGSRTPRASTCSSTRSSTRPRRTSRRWAGPSRWPRSWPGRSTLARRPQPRSSRPRSLVWRSASTR
jgi:ribonuclease Z